MADKNKTRENHKRIEFILHKEDDKVLISYLNEIKQDGILSDFLRDLIARSMQGDVNAETDVRMITEIQDLREMMLEFDERLSALEQVELNAQEIKHLWREMGRMNERLEHLRTTGAVEDDELTTPVSEDQARQDALSAKLKRYKDGGFGALTQ